MKNSKTMKKHGPFPADFATACPHCGEELCAHDQAERTDGGAVDILGDARPSPGDFAICLKCGEASRYGPGGHLRALTPDDESDLSQEAREVIRRIQAARVGAMFSFKRAGKKWMGENL